MKLALLALPALFPMPNPISQAPSAASDDRSHFLAHMGHDLRAPLTNILALTEALTDGVYGPLAPAQSETLKHIRENGQRMINMITDLVDLARFETGQLQLNPVPGEIMEACRQGLEMARGLAKSRNIAMASETIPGSINATVDLRRLRQLIAALAGAAVTSTAAQGKAAFRLEAAPSKGELKIEVFCSGRGTKSFLTENSSPVANPVSPLQRLRKMSSVAVGMLEKLVQLHGGTLAVADSDGGVAITVALPMRFGADQPSAEPPRDGPPVAAPGKSGMPTILLADDEEIIRSITKDYLESTGYRVICASNGREALDLLETETPDLIILDMQMPVLDGLEALAELRRSGKPAIAGIPVVSLSGVATPGHRERCVAAGANACLAKPFGIKDLERVIKETLAARV